MLSVIRTVLLCTLISITLYLVFSIDSNETENEALTNKSLNNSTDSVNITESAESHEELNAVAETKVHLSPKTNVFEDLFGSTLYRWNSTIDSATPPVLVEQSLSSLLREGSADAVAVYFSASWCGPCRKFTPMLAQAYADINKKLGTKLSSGQANRRFEVIWITRDNSFEEFVQYFSSMPWLAVPFDKVDGILAKLAPKYKLKGIPHLVILDGLDGSVNTLEGRTQVMQDKYGLEFPWSPKTPLNILLGLLPRKGRLAVKQRLRDSQRQIKQRLAALFRGALQGLGVPAKLLDKHLPVRKEL